MNDVRHALFTVPNVPNRNVKKKDDRTEIFTKPSFRDKIQKLIQSIFLKIVLN